MGNANTVLRRIGLFAVLTGGIAGSSLAQSGTKQPGLKKDFTADLGRGVTMEFVLIPSGSFMMGSEKGRADERPVHKVTITKPFYMGKYEVTQEQWQAAMGDNPSRFEGPKNPVECVNWEDCQKFLAKLKEKVPGKEFCLPTEAQWEYACRAGSKTEYCYGDGPAELGDYAWYRQNSPRTTHPVGQKKPNAWGLYDMHGNVEEWCSDWKGDYTDAAVSDPKGPDSGDRHVLHGGYFEDSFYFVRCASRNGIIINRLNFVGFRVALYPSRN